MKSLSYRNAKWLSYVCEVLNNGEREGDSRREREREKGGNWLLTRFGKTGSGRWLGQVLLLSLPAACLMQSIPLSSASQAERRWMHPDSPRLFHLYWSLLFQVRPVLSLSGGRCPQVGRFLATDEWLRAKLCQRVVAKEVFLASHFCCALFWVIFFRRVF